REGEAMNLNKPMTLKLGALLAAVGAAVTLIPPRVRTASLQASIPAPIQDDKSFDQAAALADLNKKIAGQETKPAAEVFKNIQILKAVPAARLLKAMELGYAKSLGVKCTHCHVAGEWEKEDKPQKQI